MDVEFPRLMSGDEGAYLDVERRASGARERIKAERERLEAERETRCQFLAAKVDEAIARILADAAQDVAAHRARRERWLKERGRGSAAGDLLPPGTFDNLICGRPRKKTL